MAPRRAGRPRLVRRGRRATGAPPAAPRRPARGPRRGRAGADRPRLRRRRPTTLDAGTAARAASMRGRPVPGIDDGRPDRAVNADTPAVVAELRSLADPSRRPGMAHVGITIDRALGVSIPKLRRLARAHRGDHELALDLWATEIHEAASSHRWSMTPPSSPAPRWTPGRKTSTRGTSATRCATTSSSPRDRRCRRPRLVPSRRGVREARRVRDRCGPGGTRSRPRRRLVHRLVPEDPPGRDRRAQRREEGRELGAATDREAEPRTARCGDRRGGTTARARQPQRSLDRARRAPRAAKRRHRGAARGTPGREA